MAEYKSENYIWLIVGIVISGLLIWFGSNVIKSTSGDWFGILLIIIGIIIVIYTISWFTNTRILFDKEQEIEANISEGNINALITIAKDGPHQSLAIAALRDLKAESAVNDLISITRDIELDEDLRINALNALLTIGDKKIRETLDYILSEEEFSYLKFESALAYLKLDGKNQKIEQEIKEMIEASHIDELDQERYHELIRDLDIIQRKNIDAKRIDDVKQLSGTTSLEKIIEEQDSIINSLQETNQTLEYRLNKKIEHIDQEDRIRKEMEETMDKIESTENIEEKKKLTEIYRNLQEMLYKPKESFWNRWGKLITIGTNFLTAIIFWLIGYFLDNP